MLRGLVAMPQRIAAEVADKTTIATHDLESIWPGNHSLASFWFRNLDTITTKIVGMWLD